MIDPRPITQLPGAVQQILHHMPVASTTPPCPTMPHVLACFGWVHGSTVPYLQHVYRVTTSYQSQRGVDGRLGAHSSRRVYSRSIHGPPPGPLHLLQYRQAILSDVGQLNEDGSIKRDGPFISPTANGNHNGGVITADNWDPRLSIENLAEMKTKWSVA